MGDQNSTPQEPSSEIDNLVFTAMREIAISTSPDAILNILQRYVLPQADFIGLLEIDPNPIGDTTCKLTSQWSREEVTLPDDFAYQIWQIARQHQIVVSGGEEQSLKEYAEETLKASSVATFSLTHAEQTSGYLIVASQEPYLYSEKEITVIQTLTGQIAVVLDNLLLTEKTDTQAKKVIMVNELSQNISSAFELETLSEVLSAKLPEMFDAAHMSLALISQDATTLDILHLNGIELEKLLIEPGSYVFEAVAKDETYYLDNLEDQGERSRAWVEAGLQSLMIVLLAGRVSPLGTLNIGAGQVGAFNSFDQLMVEQIAVQLTSILENIRLFERLQVSLEETTALYSTALAINAAQNLEEIYDTVLTEIGQLSSADRSTLFLSGPDPRGQVEHLKVAAIWDGGRLTIDEDSPVYDLTEAPVLSQFPQSRANLTFNDVVNDRRLDKNLRAFYEERGVNSLMMIPLSTGALWIGALLIEGRSGQTFNSEQVRLCRNVADQAALAIDLQLLLLLSQQTAEKEQMMREIIEEVRAAENPQDAFERAAKNLSTVLDMSPEEIMELQSNPEQLQKLDLSTKERELIESIADQVSLAIENINVIENTQRLAIREQLISDMTAQLQRSFNVDDVLETAVRTLQSMLEDYDIRLRLTPQAQETARQIVSESPLEDAG